MTEYILSHTAEQDIEEIITYIAMESPKSAKKLLNEVYKTMDMLALNPDIGHRRDDLTHEKLRFWPMKWHYLIVYLDHSPLEIVRVLSGYRDIPTLLS